jgi:hypothetical protein
MTLSGTEVRYGILASANPSAVNVSGSQSIGTSLSTLAYTDTPDVAFSLAMIIQDGDTLTMDMDDGTVTGTVAGTAQVETNTIVAASGATTAGNLTVTVTSALVTGSPLAISVPLTLAENTASLVAAEVRSVLGATTAITDHYTVGGTGADYSLTTSAINHAANDATLNLAHANDTSAGITTSASSTNTTAGVGTSRAYKFNGTAWDATDFEGIAIPTMTKLHSVLARSASTSGTVTIDDTTNSTAHACPFVSLTSSPAGAHPFAGDTVTFTAATAPVTLILDIHAGE